MASFSRAVAAGPADDRASTSSGRDAALELWGGPECTVNRVGDRFHDQIVRTGHDTRLSDLDLFADLGIAAIRDPLLWERIAPDHPEKHDWAWSDARLARLKQLGIRPIAGLVHHGSGPRYTNLLDDGFAAGLARHARAVAERYPWIDEWTPVNEPVTTARFSALYGHWYPHRRDDRAFWLALLNQIDGVRLAMRAIRRVNPAARLIQTDDLGHTYATAPVRDQADFDNARRWMSWDLLFGRVTPAHPLWTHLCGLGLGDRLRVIADDPCPPDVIGINHYLTSDRFLDHRLGRYPDRAGGGNGRQLYVDTEAVRVLDPPPAGLRGALDEAWRRYGRPLALTEVHNGCTREEQMRWMAEAWQTACALRATGIDIRAVTSWALLGSHGWNTLLTAPGRYEAGAFDVSGGTPRPTALVALLRGLGEDAPLHPVAAGAGWWRRAIRHIHPVVAQRAQRADFGATDDVAPAPILITGATGTLGQALAAACRHRNIAHVLTGREILDLTDRASIASTLETCRPWAVINAAGWVDVDAAETHPAECLRANADGAAALADECGHRGIATVSFSTDLVFDGRAGRAYLESDAPRPLNVYGESKARAERAIAALPGTHLVIRTAAFFSPFDPHNFAIQAIRAFAAGHRFRAAADHVVSPTYLPDLCDAVLDLAIDGEAGLWHLAGGEALSWAAFARRLAEACGFAPGAVDAVAADELGWRARRPVMAALASGRGLLLPPLGEAIDRFAAEFERSEGRSARAG